MPTYNDCDTIVQALDSVKTQTYQNWELIIVNDGSSDDTENVVKNYINTNQLQSKIKFLSQENADQLNAIKAAIKYVTGDLIMVLHSDDVLNDEETLKNIAKKFDAYNVDAVVPYSLPTFCEDKDGKKLKVRKIKQNKNYIKYLMLSYGCNVFVDTACMKKDVFLNAFYYNYLTWNRPFWANFETNNMVKIARFDIPFFKYRVYEGNYINSELGKLNVTNGTLRTFIDAMSITYLPFLKFQNFLFKLTNKLNILNNLHAISLNKPTPNKTKPRYIKQLICNQVGKDFERYPFYKAVYLFYKNKASRTIELNIPKDEFIYLGSDMRTFNKKMLKNELSSFYVSFMNEMNIGFNKVLIPKETSQKVQNLLKFFCIDKCVQLEEK